MYYFLLLSWYASSNSNIEVFLSTENKVLALIISWSDRIDYIIPRILIDPFSKALQIWKYIPNAYTFSFLIKKRHFLTIKKKIYCKDFKSGCLYLYVYINIYWFVYLHHATENAANQITGNQFYRARLHPLLPSCAAIFYPPIKFSKWRHFQRISSVLWAISKPNISINLNFEVEYSAEIHQHL